MSNKFLSKQIERKLQKLHELLDEIDEARNIEPDDPETWDPDTLYNLVSKLKEILELLEDQKSKQLDEYDEPIILEIGLCSLMDKYQSEEEENNEDF